MQLVACQPQSQIEIKDLASHFSVMGQTSAELIIGHIKYKGHEPDRLIKVESNIADQVEIYLLKDSQIQLQENGLILNSNQIYSSRSQNHQMIHLMLLGLKRPLIKGSQEEVTFYFEKAKPVIKKILILDTPEGESHSHHH
jgi:copper(I)-binding protein